MNDRVDSSCCFTKSSKEVRGLPLSDQADLQVKARLDRDHCGWARRKSSIRTIDFRKIEAIDQIVTLFVFVKFRSIGELCVRDANDGLLNVF